MHSQHNITCHTHPFVCSSLKASLSAIVIRFDMNVNTCFVPMKLIKSEKQQCIVFLFSSKRVKLVTKVGIHVRRKLNVQARTQVFVPFSQTASESARPSFFIYRINSHFSCRLLKRTPRRKMVHKVSIFGFKEYLTSDERRIQQYRKKKKKSSATVLKVGVSITRGPRGT